MHYTGKRIPYLYHVLYFQTLNLKDILKYKDFFQCLPTSRLKVGQRRDSGRDINTNDI